MSAEVVPDRSAPQTSPRRLLEEALGLQAQADLLEREGAGNAVFAEVESLRHRARVLRDQINQQRGVTW